MHGVFDDNNYIHISCQSLLAIALVIIMCFYLQLHDCDELEERIQIRAALRKLKQRQLNEKGSCGIFQCAWFLLMVRVR